MGIELHPDGLVCLLSEADIQARIKEMAVEISREYAGDSLLTIGILNGAVLFLADLVRQIDIPLEYDFVGFRSYNGSVSNGPLEVTKRLKADVNGKRVLIVEDIIDTGRTLYESCLVDALIEKGAVDVRLCSLLDKPTRRTHHVDIHYTGFVIEDRFVVGYGLDYDGLYRNLPYIGCYEIESE
jgi:hypoxanthine phosphoribosyltransferase